MTVQVSNMEMPKLRIGMSDKEGIEVREMMEENCSL